MSTRRTSSTPVDPSKLNNTPAALPPSPEHSAAEDSPPPLRSPDGLAPTANAASAADGSSGYLDTGETPSHPTVAETGILGAGHGPGPATGQLARRESVPGRRIVRLASFGGEGLVAKPPPGGLEGGEEVAVVDE